MKKQRNIFIVISIALLVALVLVIIIKNQTIKYTWIEGETVPTVELMNYLSFSGNATGYVTGFVAFEERDNQPRDLRQYRTIKPTSSVDESGKQVYLVEDIVDMRAIPPKSIGKEELVVEDENEQIVVLVDGAGNKTLINKQGRDIVMVDTDGSKSYLITDQTDFRRFITDWLR